MLPSDGGEMTTDGVRQLRQRLTEQGWPWLPEIPERKYTSKEWGNWRDLCGSFDPQRDYKNEYGLLLNTALYLDGIYAFDCDIDESDLMEDVYDVMVDMLGLPSCIRFRTNSPRIAALYRSVVADNIERSRDGSDGVIEVKTGCQSKLTAFGKHKDKITGVVTRMQWVEVPGNIHKDELSTITSAQVEQFLDAIAPLLGDNVFSRTYDPAMKRTPGEKLAADDVEQLYEAAKVIPNPGGGWHAWNRIGMAFYGASNGHEYGLLAFIEYTQRGGYSDATSSCTQRWLAYASYPPMRIGAGTIFQLAYQHGFRSRQPDFLPIGAMTLPQRRAMAALKDFKPPKDF